MCFGFSKAIFYSRTLFKETDNRHFTILKRLFSYIFTYADIGFFLLMLILFTCISKCFEVHVSVVTWLVSFYLTISTRLDFTEKCWEISEIVFTME